MKVAIDDSITTYDVPLKVSTIEPDEPHTAFNGKYYVKDLDTEIETTALSNDYSQLLKYDEKYYLVKGTYNPDTESDIFIEGDYITIDNTFLTYDTLTYEEYKDFRANDRSMLMNIAKLMFLLLVLNFIFNFANIYILNYASQKIVYSLRADLFDHIQNLPLSFFDKNPVGRLVTRVTNDMQNITQMFTDVLVTALKDLFLIGGTIIVMMKMNFVLAVIGLSTLPIVLIASYVFRIKARAVQRDVKVKLAKINSTLAENINGVKIIQIFNREKHAYDEFDEINKDHMKTSIKETQVYAVFRPSMNLIYSLSLSLIIWYGGGASIQGAIELGVLVAFMQYINRFFRPIFDLAEKFNIFQSAMASSERVFMLLDEKSDIIDPVKPKQLSANGFDGRIDFEDVCFSYSGKDDEKVLKGINFSAKPGETIALVGATGSGKTTIISLLNRFYDIQKGSIKIDGIDIKDMNRSDLREHIGIVLQDVFLFAGDIKGNIRLNNEHITDSDVERVSKYVNAHDFISKLPSQYDEEVKERGATLSTGQRQLLSFARALAFDPKILILDEATSSIDTETELLIQNAIEKLIKGRTTIIVAHRLSTIKNADKIIVMHKGEIKEMGSHDELIQHQGMYYDLYKLQYQ